MDNSALTENESGGVGSNSQALDAFLAAVERRAYQMAYFAVQDREEALEIVQDAMFSLVRRYSSADADEWPPLFHRILQHRIRDHYRRQKVRSVVRSWFGGGEDDDREDELESVSSATAGPQESLIGDQTIAQLKRAISALPLRQQQVFLLRAWEGLDVRSTANAIGCSEGSIKTHYSRAVARLRQLLGEEYSE